MGLSEQKGGHYCNYGPAFSRKHKMTTIYIMLCMKVVSVVWDNSGCFFLPKRLPSEKIMLLVATCIPAKGFFSIAIMRCHHRRTGRGAGGAAAPPPNSGSLST